MQSNNPRPSPIGFRYAKGKASITDAALAAEMGVSEASVVGWQDGSIPVTGEVAGAYREALISLGAGPYIAGSHQNL